jgi:CBS domain containing-hemolysin-like protein
MKSFSLFALQDRDHLIQPEEFNRMTVESPALESIADFKQYKPQMIDAYLKVSDAAVMMQVEDIKMKMVVDQKREFIGILDSDHLSAQSVFLRQINLGVKYDELLVKDVMCPRAQMLAMDYAQLQVAKIADVVALLKKSHQEYLLVVDKETHQIRGVISSRDLARRLGEPLAIEKELTFADIVEAVVH